MKNNILLYFPWYEDVHFYKDVGQIPYLLSKKMGYNFYLITQRKTWISENKNIHYLFYKKSFFRIFIFIKEIFLLQPKISMYFFFNISTLFLVLFTRIFSSSKVYVKWDIDFYNFSFKTKKSKFFYLKKKIIFLLFDFFDVVYSVETKKTFEFIKWNYNVKNLLYIPNGTSFENKWDNLPEKENIIITVGRLWTIQKNTQLFLDIAWSFLDLDIEKKWKFYAIWPIDDETNFLDYKKDFFIKYPDFQDRIIFTWAIKDRREITNYYEKAKIFLMPSRFEWSPLVLPEATINWCLLVTSDKIVSFYDITNNWKYWFSFWLDDINIWKKLYEYVNNTDLKILYEEQIAYSTKNFTWESIIEKLLLKLN